MVAAALVGMGMAGLAFAAPLSQPTPPPSPYSKPSQVRPNLPGSTRDELADEGAMLPPLVREGAFVSAARGQLVKGKSGRWFFVFDADTSGRTLPPMVLMPSVHLAGMERMAEHGAAGTRMLVTGQVTVYHDLNYLLAATPPLAVRADAPAPASPQPVEAPGSEPTPKPASPAAPAPSGSEPSIHDIVKRLDAAASSTPGGGAAAVPLRTVVENTTSSTTGAPNPAAGSGAATQGSLLSVGAIASRRGRITRGTDGSLVFTLDSGTSDVGSASKTASTGTLVLQPSQTLAAIEALSERAGEGATYTVSGEVTTYRDRNYLLVRSYKMNRTADQVMPTQ